MLIFPAIDIKDGRAVRLVKGDYATASQVADSPIAAAKAFEAAGAQWLHMVDLDGAKAGGTVNRDIIIEVANSCSMKVEIGGGIRDMDTVRGYLENGIERVILGSAALKNPDFVREAVELYGDRIVVGIDARDGKVATEGWLDTSSVDYIEFAKLMESIGVKTIVFTDISKDGTLQGPNLEQLEAINNAVSCNIIASGGVSCAEDISHLRDLFMYGAICGKSLYSGSLELTEAIAIGNSAPDLGRFFAKAELIPAIVRSADDGEVLMLAYMNEESFGLTLKTGYTWFYSRSRQELWNKGATSGHLQKVVDICYDCDCDTLLVTVEQTGAACHTGSRSCFFGRVKNYTESDA